MIHSVESNAQFSSYVNGSESNQTIRNQIFCRSHLFYELNLNFEFSKWNSSQMGMFNFWLTFLTLAVAIVQSSHSATTWDIRQSENILTISPANE